MKKSEKCRYKFPRFPCLKTLVSIPARVKFPKEEEREEMVKESKNIKDKVKKVLEDKDIMDDLCKMYNGENAIETSVEWARLAKVVEYLEDCNAHKIDKEPKMVDEEFVKAYNKFVSDLQSTFLGIDQNCKNIDQLFDDDNAMTAVWSLDDDDKMQKSELCENFLFSYTL